MKSKSINGKSPEEIHKALKAAIGNDFKPTLAIVFISIKQDRKAVTEILSKHDIDVFGATSCGEFVDGHQSQGEIVILLLDLAREAYSIFLEKIGEHSIDEAAKQVANSALSKFSNPALIVCSTGVTPSAELFDGTTLVTELSEAMGRDRIFFGGMAGDDMTLTEHMFLLKTMEQIMAL